MAALVGCVFNLLVGAFTPAVEERLKALAAVVMERLEDLAVDAMERLRTKWDDIRFFDYFDANIRFQVQDLQRRREWVEHEVEAARRNGREIDTMIDDWFKQVDEIIAEYYKYLEDEDRANTRCPHGAIANPFSRLHLGRRAHEMITKVEGLAAIRFDGVSYGLAPTSMDLVLSTNIGFESFASRKNVTSEIMAALEDSTIRMIGVCGPGGVGKTALVKTVAVKAREAQMFKVVVMVRVTRNPDPRKIQGEIADMLGLRLEEESEIGRASRLRERLKNEKENILVILDDLWEGLDLNMLGIPIDDDSFNPGTGKDGDIMKEKRPRVDNNKMCKILLISRSKEVLSNQMNVKESSIFQVDIINKAEAERLLKKMAEITDESSDFEPLITKLVHKCQGLPVAIVAVARALKNKDYSIWKDVLQRFESQESAGVYKSIEFSIKLSYDHLGSEELKSTFLLCACLVRHPLIMELMKFYVGLGMFQGALPIKEARMRIDVLVQKLKSSSLLVDSYSTDGFNMHDMIRDAAQSIASKELHIYTMRNCELDEWPKKDALERYTAISLHNCDIIDELPVGLNCPALELFHLESVNARSPMPHNFFEGMTTLKVLILTGIDLSHSPTSIKCLKGLRMLCLEQCVLDDNLSFIGELKNLRILSLFGSKFRKLPNGLGELGKLQLLDISNCFKIMIQPKVFSRLNRLEELYLRNTIIQYEVEGPTTNQFENDFLVELMNLRKLTTLDISIPNVAILPNLFFPKLDNYKIIIGDFQTLPFSDFKIPDKHETSRALALELKGGNNIHSLSGVKVLLKHVKILLMGELSGVKNIIYELNLYGFQDLKQLFILNNSNVEYIINSMEPSQPQDAFHNLESLYLYKLASIKEVCCSHLTDPSFRKLKTIKIKVCVQLKNLFSFHMVRLLGNLEAIEVSECDSLNEIVHGNNDNVVVFPQLRSLVLRSLETFTSFYTNMEVSEITMDDEHGVTPSLSLFSKEVSEITMDDEHGATPSFSLFKKEVILPKLESLKLSSINIQNIWSIDPPLSSSHFQKLMQLIVNDCNKLKHLLSLSMAASLVNLKGLFVSRCNMMEGIFHPEEINPNQENRMDHAKVRVFPYLEEIQLTNMDKLTEVWHAQVHADSFSSLISVLIQGCKKLDKIFPGHMQAWFRSLDSLKVVDCQLVEVIFEVKDSPQKDAYEIDTKLQVIILKELPNLKQVWKTDPEGYFNFKNLCKIRVYGCNKLSNVLPASVAKELGKLKDFSVRFCNGMEEIVSWEEESETGNESLVFPAVTHMEFCGLRNIKRFYKGRYTVECPNLKYLAVFNCEKLETFTTEPTNAEGQAVFSAEKVISNLEYMEIGIEEVKWLQSNTRRYRLQHLEELCLRELQSIDVLYWFLRRIPNLERLKLIRCDIGELVPDIAAAQEGWGTVLQPKALTLLYSDISDLRFERDLVLHRSIERLLLNGCAKLINIAHPSVSFPDLTYLEVASCDGLMHLMAPSTANSLVQLTTMKIVNCGGIKDIVSDVGNEEERVVNIEFSQLRTLELVTLESITSFCSYENCEFKFPSLEELIVRNCPKMKTFTESHISAPKLQNILANKEEKWSWEGDLNATIQKAFTDKLSFQYTHSLKLYDYPELVSVWNGTDSVQNGSFRNLRSLVISNCEYVVHVIPSHLLPCFENLEELEVRECRQVKVIFNIIEDLRMTKAWVRYRLKRLHLDNLPKLEHIWDKDPQGIAGFQALQDMHVDKCESLKSVFPASLAKDLAGLERLFVANCEKLVEIFAMDEAAIEGATKSFVFRCLTSLTLRELPGLKYFYPGSHTLEWPVQELDVYHCNLEIFKFRRSRSSSSEANPFPIPKGHGSKMYLRGGASTGSPDEA